MKKIIVLPFILFPLHCFSLSKDLKVVESYIPSSLEENYKEFQTVLRKGMKHKNILLLKKNINNKYQLNLKEDNLFDDELFKFVKQEQEKYDLNVDGIIDERTWYVVYDQSNDWKFQKIKEAENNWTNILKKAEGKDFFLVVNIPSMKIKGYKKVEVGYDMVYESRVIVGKRTTETPLKDFEIISIKYNPTWTPTANMIKKNAYKNGQIDTHWIKSHGLTAYNKEGEIVDVDTLDSLQNIKLVQSAGDRNALGDLKFETTSPENIYLHDTNERSLFKRNTRLYSSGCVRVQDFKELASILSEQSIEDVEKKIESEKTFFQKVKKYQFFDYTQVEVIKEDVLFLSNPYNK